jgi:type II secretory pathway pseudopilin PulG
MEHSRGIGVIEILVVIMVLGVMTVVALPQLERYMASRDLVHAARQLGGDLRLTQQYAITQDERFQLVYTTAPSSRYTIRKSSDSTLMKDADLPAGITITGSFASTPAEFTSTGAPSAAGQFCLSDGTLILRVDVQPATGRVQITEVVSCP